MILITADFVYIRWLGDRKAIEKPRLRSWNQIVEIERRA